MASESLFQGAAHALQLQWELQEKLCTSQHWALIDWVFLSAAVLHLAWSQAELLQEQGLHIISLYSTLNYLINVLYSTSCSSHACEGLNQKIVPLHEQSLEEQSALVYSQSEKCHILLRAIAQMMVPGLTSDILFQYSPKFHYDVTLIILLLVNFGTAHFLLAGMIREVPATADIRHL